MLDTRNEIEDAGYKIMRIALTLVVVGFCFFCGILVFECGLFDSSYTVGKSCILLQQTTVDEKPAVANASAEERTQLKVADFINFGADNAPARSVTLGSVDPKSGFKFQLELSSKGAAVSKATFSEFDEIGRASCRERV